MNSTLALIVNIPTLILLYVLVYFSQALSGKRQFYGISLNGDYFAKDEFKALDKRFKKLLTIGFVLFVLLTLILIYILKFYQASTIIPILGFTLYQFVIYVDVYNKVKSLKSEILLTNPKVEIKKTKLLLDTDFVNKKNTMVKMYSIIYLIPVFITILVGIYTLSKYSTMPDMIPTHWGFSGEADAFSKNSFMSVFGQIFMFILISITIYISSVSSLKTRAKLSVDDVEKSKKAHLYYLNLYGLSFAGLNTLCQMLFIIILIAIANNSNINPYVMWTCTTLLILNSFYLTYIYYKSPNRMKDAVYSVEDDDNLWIIGFLYNNPNDPSLFVNKRFGVGWTINIGTIKGKLFFILPFIVIFIAVLFI